MPHSDGNILFYNLKPIAESLINNRYIIILIAASAGQINQIQLKTYNFYFMAASKNDFIIKGQRLNFHASLKL